MGKSSGRVSITELSIKFSLQTHEAAEEGREEDLEIGRLEDTQGEPRSSQIWC